MSQDYSAVINPYNYERRAQAFRNKALASAALCDDQFKDSIKVGDQVDFGMASGVGVQTYVPHTNISRTGTVLKNDSLTITFDEVSDFYTDIKELKQAPFDVEATQSAQMGFVLAQKVDQQTFSTAVANAGATLASSATTVDESNIENVVTAAKARLGYNRVRKGAKLCAFVPFNWTAYLGRLQTAKGFGEADSALKNGFAGRSHGFEVMESDNLPYTQSFTMTTNPSDGNTVTFYGQTFTYKTTPANPGDVKIGASAAATHANLIAAVANSGTGDGTDYVALEQESQLELKNAQVVMGTISSNVATLSGYGHPFAVDTLTEGTDGFVTDAVGTVIFAAEKSVARAMQIMPELEIRKEPRSYDINMMMRQVYGLTVFDRYTRDIVTLDFNATNSIL